MMSDFKNIKLEVENNIAIITLNRPEAANGLDMAMAQELMKVSIICSEDKDIGAVIITGEGKMFCAGGDLKSFASYGEQLSSALMELTTYLHGAISRFARMNAPVIIAVNGVAAGAGFSLAIGGDMVIASDKAKFTMAYTNAGLSPDGSSSYYLPRLIGLRKTQELMLTNRLLKADEALEWGLINKVVGADSLMDEAKALAQTFTQGPTLAYGMVKKLMNTTFSSELETQMELEAQAIAQMCQNADGKEGIAAFLEKRKPNFKGA